MSQNQNIKIPAKLFNDTLYLLEALASAKFEEDVKCLINSALDGFQRKKDSMTLRETYSKVVSAKDDDERFDARMEYLEQRRKFREPDKH